MLRRVSDLPKEARGFRRDSYTAKDIREFCRNKTYDVAELIIEGKKPNAIVVAARKYIKQHKDQCKGVSVTLRGGKVYLYRKDER